jgi:transcriptional antiterminator NusG
MSELNWYVVHTYSGYENKVKANIEKTIENRKLQDQIFEVRVPLQDVVEMKGGVKKNVSKKMFPGYVLVNMVMNDDTWYVVRNTRGVTGFVGPGADPVPLSEAEMRNLGIVAQSDNEVEIDIEIGDLVEVTSGAWEGRVSTVTAINMNKQTVTIEVDMFGRETSVEIGFLDVKKL